MVLPAIYSAYQLAPQDRKPLLEEYFKVNPYPSGGDKKALAKLEGASYRQVHVWFQNQRSRAKEQGLLAKKPSTTPTPVIPFVDQAWLRLQQTSPKDTTDTPKTASETPTESNLAKVWTSPSNPTVPAKRPAGSDFVSSTAPRRRAPPRPRPISMDELITAFGCMNVRGVGTKTAIGAEKGYAARQAITYVAPKAPLPSFVSQEMLPRASPMVIPVATPGRVRKIAALPRRSLAGRRRSESMSSTSTRSSSECSDRVPSLTYSDTSDSSSSASPSPEIPSRPELLPSPPKPSWVDLPSPSFPVINTPPSLASHDSPSFSWREDAGVEGDDDEDDDWAHVANQASLVRSKKPQASTPGEESATSTSAPDPSRSPATSPHDPLPALQASSTTTKLTSPSTASKKDGVITHTSWDELDLSKLDADSATAGDLVNQLGSWDGWNASHNASQFDFGPVPALGGAPSTQAVKVQSEPAENVRESTWMAQLSSDWNAQQVFVAADGLGFDNFAPSAFDGFIASNWNLEPQFEPASNPSSMFGKTGFEAYKASSPFPFGPSSNMISASPFSAFGAGGLSISG
ncbi:hypothetical protein FB107DRAFT_245335 [Schizophyllum commune]